MKKGKKTGFGFVATWYDSWGAYICSLPVMPEDYQYGIVSRVKSLGRCFCAGE